MLPHQDLSNPPMLHSFSYVLHVLHPSVEFGALEFWVLADDGHPFDHSW
jgi:hypothetical protein